MSERPTAEALRSRLRESEGYPRDGAALVAQRLLELQPELQPAFIEWWERGAVPLVEVAGESTDSLVRDHGLRPLAALLTLDWLIRSPSEAAAALRAGRDHVHVGAAGVLVQEGGRDG